VAGDTAAAGDGGGGARTTLGRSSFSRFSATAAHMPESPIRLRMGAAQAGSRVGGEGGALSGAALVAASAAARQKMLKNP